MYYIVRLGIGELPKVRFNAYIILYATVLLCKVCSGLVELLLVVIKCTVYFLIVNSISFLR